MYLENKIKFLPSYNMMNRKHLIKNIVGASANVFGTSAVSNTAISSQLKKVEGISNAQSSNLQRGVSFYSYQEEFYNRTMTLEDCITEASDIGAYGIELLPVEMMRGYPHATDSWIDEWFYLMDKYNTKPICYTQFQDIWLYRDHVFTLEEGVKKLSGEIKFAKELGFKVMRVNNNVDLNVVEKCIPYAEENDIWLGREVHAPFAFLGDEMNSNLELIEKTRTNHFGMLIDTSVFETRPITVRRDRRIRDGILTKDIALYIEQAWLEKVPQEKVEETVQKMKPKTGDLEWITEVFTIKPIDPRAFVPYMSKIRHVHAKVYDMTVDYQELTQDTEKIISALKEGGFDGYICTEHEGQRYTQDIIETDSCEQVRRNQLMLKRLIG